MGIKSNLTVLGMMSGTSMDGLDCIIVNLNYSEKDELYFDIIEKNTFQIPVDLRNEISSVILNPHQDFKSLHQKLGLFYLSCTYKMIKIKNLELIAFHGQTIYHEERVKSIQIGNPEPLFKKFNIPIIYNFRKADIEVGGTGAPLMPFLDWAILKKSGFNDITLNIGGISNITVVPRDDSPSYFVDRNHREYESMMSVIKSNPPTPTTPVEGINDVCGDTGCCKYYFHRRDSFMDWDWYWEACCHTWWLFC